MDCQVDVWPRDSYRSAEVGKPIQSTLGESEFHSLQEMLAVKWHRSQETWRKEVNRKRETIVVTRKKKPQAIK